MALGEWMEDKSLGKTPCNTARESWQCPNMRRVAGDFDMEYEHYECKLCGRTEKLDYDEMR